MRRNYISSDKVLQNAFLGITVIFQNAPARNWSKKKKKKTLNIQSFNVKCVYTRTLKYKSVSDIQELKDLKSLKIMYYFVIHKLNFNWKPIFEK